MILQTENKVGQWNAFWATILHNFLLSEIGHLLAQNADRILLYIDGTEY